MAIHKEFNSKGNLFKLKNHFPLRTLFQGIQAYFFHLKFLGYHLKLFRGCVYLLTS